MNAAESKLTTLGNLAHALHENADPWHPFELAAMTLFGTSRLFTVLSYDAAQSLLWRLHTSDSRAHPAGGAKRVSASPYAAHIYRHGRCFVGSTREDLKVFSEYQSLWDMGCESVLNIPVRHRGQAIGTLNLLGAAHQYDNYDTRAAWMLSRIAAPYVLEALQVQQQTVDMAALDSI